jgi:hypothetical protein
MEVKSELGLSLTEYVFLDAVYHLQTKTGECYASNKYFEDLLGVGTRQVQRIKKEMEEKGLLTILKDGVFTKEKWNQCYLGGDINDAQEATKMSRHATKMSPTSDKNVAHTYNNKIDSKSNTSETVSREEVPGENKPVDMIPLIIKEMESLDPKNKRFYGNTTQRDACKFLLEEYGFDLVVQVIHAIPSLKAKIAYMPSVTTPVELRDKWVKIKDAVGRERAKAQDKIPEVLFA